VRIEGAAGLALAMALAVAGCGSDRPSATPEATSERPSILLVTLDTTRADAVVPQAGDAIAPHLSALAQRGTWFAQAYTTAPMTLPAHVSILSGLYPAAHGIHENARHLRPDSPLLAERLRQAGYRTAAFVSGLPLDGRFGLARGFDLYDDEMGSGGAERLAGATTDRALSWLAESGDGPFLLWVHYFDPHDPYEPPEPFRSRYEATPYLGEVAYMDQEFGRLLAGFDVRCGDGVCNILVAGDHGESLGEHGEQLHGRLLYQGVMRVPLITAGAGVVAGERQDPVSTRQVFDTVLGWAGLGATGGLLEERTEPVLGEAMKPHLQYGWQPQVMAVSGRLKAIRSGAVELYDVVEDPGETRDLAGEVELGRELTQALTDYPLPRAEDQAEAEGELTDEMRQELAALGYIGSGARPAPRQDAPSPARMTHLFADMDAGARSFVDLRYAQAIPRLARVLERDPGNLAIALRLAVAHSVLGHDREALDYLERAAVIDPDSTDLAHYSAMHFLRSGAPERAASLFEKVLEHSPRRLPALRGLATIRQRQNRPAEAATLLDRALAIDGEAADYLRLGELRMELTDTQGAIDAFEAARALDPTAFKHHLELGVCYLANQRFQDAGASLDRVPPEHPAYALALFKRAQVSVLLREADREARIRLAWRHADGMTGPLFETEALFEGVALD
jgi:tetratricopeptide (TPR) repeat protein